MTANRDFALPDLGEGLTESELVAWKVDVGDTVELNQIIAEVETAKALVELPSPFAGVVSKLYAEPGTTVTVGSPIVAFEVADAAAAAAAEGEPAAEAAAESPAESPAVVEGESDEAATPQREPVLVGYGPAVASGARPQRRARRGSSSLDEQPPQDEQRPLVEQRPPVEPAETQPPLVEPAETQTSPVEPSETPTEAPRSTPPVRKHARDLGIDLTTIIGTGEAGLITREDVDRAASGVSTGSTGGGEASSAGGATRGVGELRGADAGGGGERESRTPIAGVRKATAAAMVQSAFTAPHAAAQLTVDVTPTLELIETLSGKREFTGIRFTILTAVAKAVCIAVGRNPSVNGRWDDKAQEIVEHHYVNLGIAAATPRGLIVPNIKDAHRLTLPDMARAIGELVETARSGKASPEHLRGGTLTITNVGVLGVDSGLPILNPGEAAILAIGAVRRQPWEHRGEIALRSVMTLTLSFDHRLVDGEQGSRFLADVGAILADPAMVLTMV
ncbi:dihydrolipoamide acetyltransferase family protein [Diaminobutyricimonas sp. LJ205]|uniref:dihydrolipoamide acetyltransferase family protein n=1 Tax=Diaminobutyricimonas sp. LJ205 TaxID=2683590 RepID=UPI0012F4978B|nr:dihydrolipoamide acetyltransferase family protein [Diaminobutyricimonas sp. LJ205]